MAGTGFCFWALACHPRQQKASNWEKPCPRGLKGRISSRGDTALTLWGVLSYCVCMASIQYTSSFPVILKEIIASQYPRRSVCSRNGNENVCACTNMGLFSPSLSPHPDCDSLSLFLSPWHLTKCVLLIYSPYCTDSPVISAMILNTHFYFQRISNVDNKLYTHPKLRIINHCN